MKKYEIEINNEVYRVTVKELDADADMSTGAPESTREAMPAQENAPSQGTPVASGGTEVTAPMPGTILKVNVTSGQTVSAGDTLVVLEAMKMENEVVAPADGVVGDVLVSANDRVQSGQLLLTI